MSPHRSHGRGSFILDRYFDTVGRIRRASGTKDTAVFKQINAMLTALDLQSRHDLLEGIRDGRYQAAYVLTWFKQRALDRIPAADVLAALGKSIDAWQHALDCSPEHRRSIGISRKALAIEPRHILHDAPALLEAYRARAQQHPDSFNKARAHLMAFLRDQLGQSHPLWRAISDSRPMKKARRIARAKLSVDEARRLVVQLGPKAGAAAWSMAATGMGPKEYWSRAWEIRPDRVHIDGTKRAGRVRDVPRWTAVTLPELGRSTFQDVLREVTAGRIQPYDFRRAFARWCAEAGIVTVNQGAYMGHGPRTMTDLYQLGELPGQFAGDAAKLRAYAGEPEIVPSLKLTGT